MSDINNNTLSTEYFYELGKSGGYLSEEIKNKVYSLNDKKKELEYTKAFLEGRNEFVKEQLKNPKEINSSNDTLKENVTNTEKKLKILDFVNEPYNAKKEQEKYDEMQIKVVDFVNAPNVLVGEEKEQSKKKRKKSTLYKSLVVLLASGATIALISQPPVREKIVVAIDKVLEHDKEQDRLEKEELRRNEAFEQLEYFKDTPDEELKNVVWIKAPGVPTIQEYREQQNKKK